MIHAYNEAYLSDAMAGMGAMLDYAINSCGEPLPMFYARFLRSGIPEQMERGNPRYLCGLSGIELAQAVARRTGSPVRDAESLIDMGSPEYWAGWTLAYLQWYFGISYKALHTAGITAESLHLHYATLHEADLSKAVAYATKVWERHQSQSNPLKRLRKNARLTQQELARLSGLSLRVLRAYEQSQLSLAKASAVGLIRLARVLGCSVEELVV